MSQPVDTPECVRALRKRNKSAGDSDRERGRAAIALVESERSRGVEIRPSVMNIVRRSPRTHERYFPARLGIVASHRSRSNGWTKDLQTMKTMNVRIAFGIVAVLLASASNA